MLLRNPTRRLLDLVGSPPLEVGDVASITDGIAAIDLQGGGTVHARGAATVGQRVYVRGGTIEGPAPSLPVDLVEV
jgi:hypothetical protein